MGVTQAWKRNRLCEKGEIPPHFSGTPQTERMFFHSAASKITRLFAKFRGFASGLRLLLERRHAETSIIESTTLDLSITGDDYILTSCLGDIIISIGFRKNFHSHRMVVEPRCKVEIWKVSGSLFLLPSRILLQPSTDTEEANELRWSKKKNNQKNKKIWIWAQVKNNT